MNIESCKKTCRTCLSARKQHEHYRELDFHLDIYGGSIRNILQACVPEMDLELCGDNVICDLCLTLLKTSYEFKIKCLSAEEKIFQYITRKGLSVSNTTVDLNDLYSNEQVENLEAKSSIIKEEYYISSDDDEIKPVVSRSQSPIQMERDLVSVANPNSNTFKETDLFNLNVSREVSLVGNALNCNGNISSNSQPLVGGPSETKFSSTGNKHIENVFLNDSGFTNDFTSDFQIIDLCKSSTDDSDSDDEFEDIEKTTNAYMIQKLINQGNINHKNNNDSNTVNSNIKSNSNVIECNPMALDSVQQFENCTDIKSLYRPWERNLLSKDSEKVNVVNDPSRKGKLLWSKDNSICNAMPSERSGSMLRKSYCVGNNGMHPVINESYLNTFKQCVVSGKDMSGAACMTCQTCSNGFSSQYELENHLAKHFEKPSDFAVYNRLNRYFLCPICGKQSYKKRHFIRHFYKHKGKLPYRCRQCSFVTAQKSALKTHKLVEHYSQQQHVCPRCKKSFPNEYFLMYHLKTHEKDDLDSSQDDLQTSKKSIAVSQGIDSTFCKDCKKYFLNEYEFMLHKVQQKCVSTEEGDAVGTKSVIPKLRIFKCGYCCYSTTVTDQLQQHVKDHENTVMMNWKNCFDK